MAEDTRVIMSTTRRRVKVFSSGLTAESTKEDGRTENNTVLEPTHPPAVKQSKENGKKVKDFTGFKTNETILNFLML